MSQFKFKDLQGLRVNDLTIFDLQHLLDAYIKYVDFWMIENIPTHVLERPNFWIYYPFVTNEFIMKNKTFVQFEYLLCYNIYINRDVLIQFVIKNINQFSDDQKRQFCYHCLNQKPLSAEIKALLVPFIETYNMCYCAILNQNFDAKTLASTKYFKTDPNGFKDIFFRYGIINSNAISNLKMKKIDELLKKHPNNQFTKLVIQYGLTIDEINWETVINNNLNQDDQDIFPDVKSTDPLSNKKLFLKNQSFDVFTMFFKPVIVDKNIKLFKEFINIPHPFTSMPKEIFLADYFNYWFKETNFFKFSQFSEDILIEFFEKIIDFKFMNQTRLVSMENKRNERYHTDLKNILELHIKNIGLYQNITEDFVITYRQFNLIEFASSVIKFSSKILDYKQRLNKEIFFEKNQYITQDLFVEIYQPIFYDNAKKNYHIKASWYRTYYESRLNAQPPKHPDPPFKNAREWTDEARERSIINKEPIDPTNFFEFLTRQPTIFEYICKNIVCSLKVKEILFLFASTRNDDERNICFSNLLQYQSLSDYMLKDLIEISNDFWFLIFSTQILSLAQIDWFVVDKQLTDSDILKYQIVPLVSFTQLELFSTMLKPLSLSEAHVSYLITSNKFDTSSITYNEQQTLNMIFNPLFKTSNNLIANWYRRPFAWVNFSGAPDDLLQTLDDVERIADKIIQFIPVTSDFVVKYRLFTTNTCFYSDFDESFWAKYWFLFPDPAKIFAGQKFSITFLKEMLLPSPDNLKAIVDNKKYSHQELDNLKRTMPKYKWPAPNPKPCTTVACTTVASTNKDLFNFKRNFKRKFDYND